MIELLVAVLLASPTSEDPTPEPTYTETWVQTALDCEEGIVSGVGYTYNADGVLIATALTERPAFGDDCAVIPTQGLPNNLAETGPVTGWLLPVGLAMLGAGVLLRRRFA